MSKGSKIIVKIGTEASHWSTAHVAEACDACDELMWRFRALPSGERDLLIHQRASGEQGLAEQLAEDVRSEVLSRINPMPTEGYELKLLVDFEDAGWKFNKWHAINLTLIGAIGFLLFHKIFYG